MKTTPEAVAAAMKFAKDIPMTQSDALALCPDKLDEPYSATNTILAARVEELEAELNKLTTPHGVHQNLLVGKLPYTRAGLLHVLGIQEADVARVEELEEQVKAAQAAARELREALEHIKQYGGTTTDTECGPLSHNGGWCAEQARAVLAKYTKEEGK